MKGEDEDDRAAWRAATRVFQALHDACEAEDLNRARHSSGYWVLLHVVLSRAFFLSIVSIVQQAVLLLAALVRTLAGLFRDDAGPSPPNKKLAFRILSMLCVTCGGFHFVRRRK